MLVWPAHFELGNLRLNCIARRFRIIWGFEVKMFLYKNKGLFAESFQVQSMAKKHNTLRIMFLGQ